MRKLYKLSCACLSICFFILALTACVQDNIKVTDVTLNKAEMQLEIDSGFQLTPTITPEKAKNKTVTWLSDKPDIVSVSGSGWVEGKALGTAKITVTTNDGSFIAACTVTVISATGITKAQVKSAFEGAGYTEEYYFGLDTVFLPAYTYTRGADSFTAIFGTNAEIATEVKPIFDEKAQANGLICKQNGRILYYGSSDATAIFEALSAF